jgi:hypothetical protein
LGDFLEHFGRFFQITSGGGAYLERHKQADGAAPPPPQKKMKNGIFDRQN